MNLMDLPRSQLIVSYHILKGKLIELIAELNNDTLKGQRTQHYQKACALMVQQALTEAEKEISELPRT